MGCSSVIRSDLAILHRSFWRSHDDVSLSRSKYWCRFRERRRDEGEDDGLLGDDRRPRLLHDGRHLRAAILAILRPGLPRLKEWAYAGTFFNMMGAIVSHVARNDGAWIIVVTVTIAAITLASWALRPQSRRL